LDAKIAPQGVTIASEFAQDAHVLQVLIGQMAKRGDANSIFRKALRVLGQTEFFEPVRKVLHCAAPSATTVYATISDETSDVNRPLRLG
jgi:hypothetical protein